MHSNPEFKWAQTTLSIGAVVLAIALELLEFFSLFNFKFFTFVIFVPSLLRIQQCDNTSKRGIRLCLDVGYQWR